MPIDFEGLALEAGLPAAIAKKFRRDRGQDMTTPEKSYWAKVERFAALVLEAAARVCDVTPPEPFRPSIEAAHAIRAMKPGESNELQHRRRT
jgi:hypothetical protein